MGMKYCRETKSKRLMLLKVLQFATRVNVSRAAPVLNEIKGYKYPCSDLLREHEAPRSSLLGMLKRRPL